MKTKLIVATCVALTSIGTFAYAGDDDVKITGAAGGAVTGAIVGGPVGAVIGGAVGLAAGAAIDPPPQKVVTYVQEQPAQQTIVLKERVVVGKPLPDRIVIRKIPNNDTYAYAVVNKQRVIVDPRTKTVIKIVE